MQERLSAARVLDTAIASMIRESGAPDTAAPELVQLHTELCCAEVI
ncbi:hypothetical protein PC128_g14222 [Phytophthora cactorum]|nr:hypothetical protein PC128_g14222 [Phytophthora cactorum]